MHNPGEEIAGLYLKIHFGCEFVEYNLQTPDVQGEIDVVGINVRDRKLYVCEAATHLTTGMLYVNPKNNQSDNVNRFVKKFLKDITYAEKYFQELTRIFMLWSPIVKNPSDSVKHHQTRDTQEIAKQIKEKTGVDLVLVINDEYQRCLDTLREYAARESKELKSPILRLMQIEERLKGHLTKTSIKS